MVQRTSSEGDAMAAADDVGSLLVFAREHNQMNDQMH